VHNYPWYRAWHEKYGEKGVTVIGVHTPETEGEANLDKVKKKVKDEKIAWTVAVDTKGKTWKAWDNQYWPCVYLVDKKGKVRYRWEGELNSGKQKGEEILRGKIEELLAEKD
jgi:hypothetical protein